jgi:chorismate dehydratase
MLNSFILFLFCTYFATKIKIKHLERKIRVGAVSYLNTKPLLYGIQHSSLIDDITLRIDFPSRIAQMLLEDDIDIGLVPVALIPKLREYHIHTAYCIGSNGPVASVCLFSEEPLEKITKVLLDYQSQTSVKLASLLIREYWKLNAELIDAGREFATDIKGSIGGIMIGDRALKQRLISPYHYDLGQAWKEWTGLPFVYAAWISNKILPEDFLQKFNVANANGICSLDKVIAENSFPAYDLRTYFTQNISYDLSAEKIKGMKLFLEKMNNTL